MKNMKMKTKLILGFMLPIIIMVFNILFSNITTERAATLTDPVKQERYVAQTNLFTIGLAVVSAIVTFLIAVALIRVIERSVKQLADAAKEIAVGKVDINLVKYHNDEFGELVDEYTAVVDNIKSQAHIAEEVASGNLTIKVVPKSAEDVLGNSLKKLVDDNFHALSNISDAGSQVTIGAAQVASASQALAQDPQNRQVQSKRSRHRSARLPKRQNRTQSRQMIRTV